MSLTFQYPEAFALLLPLGLAWFAWLRSGSGRYWRLAMIVALTLAATAPELAWQRGGSDVVVVLDRSSSMGDARAAQQELVELVADQRDTGDRLAVVIFGEDVAVASPPAERGAPRLSDDARTVSPEGSELARALEAAAALVAGGRSGRVVVHSDGELSGPGARRAAAALALAGVPVDVLPVQRARQVDAAVAAVEVPDALRVGESFIGAVRFTGDAVEQRAWRVVRSVRLPSGEVARHEVASGEVALAPGQPAAVRFADRPPAAGVVVYEVHLDDAGDRVTANNHATAALRIGGAEAVLVIGGDGQPGNLSRALAAAGLDVRTRAEGPVALGELAGVATVVLEQVPAGALGVESMYDIARWVQHLGGGLVMTGGRRGFGAGGFHRSPIEEVLPVTLELRDEHRKFALAMAVTLDRSGSMGVTVAGGRTKMDLANSGTIAAIELLGPGDEVAIHAVDSAPHVIVPLTAVSDAPALISRVRGIRSGGGGIYVYEALKAAGQELLASKKLTRHLVLFADAADAVEPGDYVRLIADLVSAGVTISVIGLGAETDPDAVLLKDIAARGNGRCWFVDRAEDLPRVFAQETVLVARSAWVEDRVGLSPRPALTGVVGPTVGLSGWPAVAGYNVTYARPRGDVLALAPGDPEAPAIAAWRVGSGRVVALPFDLDPVGDPALTSWEGYAPLVAGLARWAAGSDEAALGALSATRHGRSATLRLELDPARVAEWPGGAPAVTLLREGGVAEPLSVPLLPVDRGVYEVVVPMSLDAVIPAVLLGDGDTGEAIAGPALRLLYSPEAAPRDGAPPGFEVLADLARQTGGAVRADVGGVYENPASPGRASSLSPLLLALALALLLLEIAVRRMRLGLPRLRFGRPRAVVAASSVPTTIATAPASSGGVSRRPARAPARSSAPAAATEEPPAPAPTLPPPATGLGEALRELRKRR